MTIWKQARPPLTVSMVSTVSDNDAPNASPKTWWTPVSYDPVMVTVSVKAWSDTLRNINRTKLFALHLPPSAESKKVLHTGKPLPYGENELDDVGLTWRMHRSWVVIEDWPVFCCTAAQVIRTGDHDLVIAHVIDTQNIGDDGVKDVLLHRGRNVFVNLGGDVEEEPY